MLNKILGIILIIIGAILALGFLVGLPGVLTQLMGVIKEGSAYAFGTFMGYLTANLVIGVVAFLLFKFGLKLSKR